MLKATHFPPIPIVLPLRKSLVPILTISSLPSHSLQKVTNFSTFHSVFSRPITPSRPYLQSLTLRQISPMAGNPQLRLSASFNFESTNGDNREILVQHLLLKEDDQKLLLELQQRVARGLSLELADYFESLFSLPVPPANPHGTQEDPTTFSGRSLPEYLEQGKVQKLLLFGLEGSGGYDEGGGVEKKKKK